MTARVTAKPAQSAPVSPTATATLLPASGCTWSRSWAPTTGTSESAVLTTSSRCDGSSCKTKPRRERKASNPEVFANKTVGQVADHYERIIDTLTVKPAIVGHSFGGLIVQMLAGRGVAAATVAVDPAPFRGVLLLPLSALKAG